MKLTIGVAVYNGEKYISRCIDSIIKEYDSLKEKIEFELLIVNDGSKDNSESILKGYSDKFAFIKVITQENAGLAHVRRVILDKASGDYLWFVDVDDEIDEGAIEFIANQIQKARQNGFVETILGRRRYLKDINSNNFVVRGHSERNAVNTPIQGSAADIIKKAMINIDKILSESDLQTKMLLQVHDELLFEVPENEVELVSNLIKTEMENAVKTTVPLLVEVGVGDNWLEAH